MNNNILVVHVRTTQETEQGFSAPLIQSQTGGRACQRRIAGALVQPARNGAISPRPA
jgi:hypothetical protein